MRSLAALALTASLFASSAVAAQTVRIGARVRVTGSDVVAPIIGNVQTIRNDSLLILEDGPNAQLWKFKPTEVKKFEVSDGVRHFNYQPVQTWTLVGIGTGALVSGMVDLILNKKAKVGYRYNYQKGALVGGAIGGGAGLLYGSTFSEERWRDVPVPRRVGMTPGRSGFALQTGFTF